MKRGRPLNKCNIIGIYLAAGSSHRFGSDKLGQHIRGVALGTLALSTALQTDLQKVIVVTKESDISWLKPFLKNKKYNHITCPQAHLGQAHSIQCGLDYAEAHQAEAIVIMLADQPFITVNMIQSLMESYVTNKNVSFVAAQHNGVICPPILFSRHMFQDLHTLKGDHGAKNLLNEKSTQGIFIEFPYKHSFYDIDTKMDYEYVLREGLS